MGGNIYEVRPGSLLEKVLERSTAQSLQRVSNAELVKTLETTDVIETKIDRYIALLFAADVADIAAVRALSEAIAWVDKRSKLIDFSFKMEDSSQQQREREAKNTEKPKEIVETEENKKREESEVELGEYGTGKEQMITNEEQRCTAQEQDTKKEERNEKASRYNSSLVEAEGKKESKEEDLKILQEDATEVPLEQSIWASDNRPCDNETPVTARISAYNVLGGTKLERTGMIKWMLNTNRHITKIEEVFVKGNSWIEVSFDCKRGREKAINRIKRKGEGWFNLLPVETRSQIESKKEQDEAIDKYRIKNKQRENERSEDPKWKEPKQKETQLSKIRKQDEAKTEVESLQTENVEEAETTRYLTIWDLPSDINEKELKYMCRSMKNMHIIWIKRSQYKALAVVTTDYDEEKDNIWTLPLGSHKLARVTEGNEDYMQREKQSHFTAKLLDIPKGASEVLLLRCLRNKRAKVVYIPVNRNRNQKNFAIITFTNAQEAEAAQTTPIWYNNHRVSWENLRRRKTYEREESRGRRQERSKSSNKRQLNYRRQEASRVRGTRHETPIKKYREMESDFQLQNIEA